jgi:hypothetical protein
MHIGRLTAVFKRAVGVKAIGFSIAVVVETIGAENITNFGPIDVHIGIGVIAVAVIGDVARRRMTAKLDSQGRAVGVVIGVGIPRRRCLDGWVLIVTIRAFITVETEPVFINIDAGLIGDRFIISGDGANTSKKNRSGRAVGIVALDDELAGDEPHLAGSEANGCYRLI